MSDPKEIYIQPDCCADPETGRMWCEDPDPIDCDDGVPWTRYVRADVVEQMIKALETRYKIVTTVDSTDVEWAWKVVMGEGDE